MRNQAQSLVCANGAKEAEPPRAGVAGVDEGQHEVTPASRRRPKTFGLVCGYSIAAAIIGLGVTFGEARRANRPLGAAAHFTSASLLSDRPIPPRRPAPRVALAGDPEVQETPVLLDAADNLEANPPLLEVQLPAQNTETVVAQDDQGRASASPSTVPDLSISAAAVSSHPDEGGPAGVTEPSPALRGLVERPLATLAPAPPRPLAPAPPRASPDPRVAEAVRVARERAEDRRRIGDIFGMRLFLEHAARLGSRDAQLRLAQSYDERYLTAWGARGVRPDPAFAAALYEEAADTSLDARIP